MKKNRAIYNFRLDAQDHVTSRSTPHFDSANNFPYPYLSGWNGTRGS